MTDETTFEPVTPRRTVDTPTRRTRLRERLRAWGVLDGLRWRAAGWDAVWWILALGAASLVTFGLVWGVGEVGVNELDREGFLLTGMLGVSIISWLIGGAVAVVSVWRSVENPSWLQRGWWMGVLLAGLSGLVPYSIALAGLLPFFGPLALAGGG